MTILNLVVRFYAIIYIFECFQKFKFEWIFRIVLEKSCCEYVMSWRLIISISFIILLIIFTLVCIAFWAVDPMTTNMSFVSDRFFESKGREVVDSGDGNLDTVINQIGFSILTWHVLMNLNFFARISHVFHMLPSFGLKLAQISPSKRSKNGRYQESCRHLVTIKLLHQPEKYWNKAMP